MTNRDDIIIDQVKKIGVRPVILFFDYENFAGVKHFVCRPRNFHHFIFIISQLWLTSHPRSTVVLLDTGTPGTSREIYSEDADSETRTRSPSVINRVL